jgi:hypothetical protein
MRHRDIAIEAAHMGAACDPVLSEVQGCGLNYCEKQCDPESCEWSDWEEWSACDKCGGQAKRFRHVRREAKCGGLACEALASEETTNCTRACHDPYYCAWGEWQDWGECSATCGAGEKIRTRYLTLVPEPPEQVRGLAELQIKDLSQLDESLLDLRFRDLQRQAEAMQIRRLPELAVAFSCGGLALLVCSAIYCAVSRSYRRISDTSGFAVGQHAWTMIPRFEDEAEFHASLRVPDLAAVE